MVNPKFDNDYIEQETDYDVKAGTTYLKYDSTESKGKSITSWKLGNEESEIVEEQDILQSHQADLYSNTFMNLSIQTSKKNTDNNLSTLVLRVHYIELILKSLNGIVNNREEPTFLVDIHSLLWTLIEARDTILRDPLIEFSSALYDALKCDNNWNNFSAEQYSEVIKIFEKLGRQKKLGDNIIEKSILKLEKIGFDTTPYSADIRG